MDQTIYYAIGDIHGEAEKLTILHGRIARRHAADFPGQEYVLVHLGDYVDRGPESYDVVKLLMEMEADENCNVINLRGNHEQLMLEAYTKEETKPYHRWIDNGGQHTVVSYRRAGFDEPPAQHLSWIANLPTYYWDRTAKLIFVHAGIDTKHFPNDGEDRHMWTRSRDFFETKNWENPALEGVSVIHGHTPTKTNRPEIDGDFKRINIDTGACYGGELTAVVLAHGQSPQFISV